MIPPRAQIFRYFCIEKRNKKKSVKNSYLKSRNFSEENKIHPEHKYSVTFVSKVGITKPNPSKIASLKVEFCLKNKIPPRAQFFRYFCIESRNNKNKSVKNG